MLAYKTYTEVGSGNEIKLSGLPFKKGDIVEILIVSENNDEIDQYERWKSLFKLTQSHIGSSNISDEDIETEIKLFREDK